MIVSYRYTNKKTGETYSWDEMKKNFQNNFEKYADFSAWVDENFDEEKRYHESPYERARHSVYSTGNVWAIDNWNATH